MLTNILFLLAVTAGSLAADLTYSDGNNVDTKVVVAREEVKVESQDITVIVDYRNNIMAIKPKNEAKCMVIRGIDTLGKILPVLKDITAIQYVKTTSFPNETRSIKVKQSVSKLSPTLSSMAKVLCPNNVLVDISTVADSSSVPNAKAIANLHAWWPWFNWWPRPCPWCNYHYRWPCFYWPFWFYYGRYMFVIYPGL